MAVTATVVQLTAAMAATTSIVVSLAGVQPSPSGRGPGQGRDGTVAAGLTLALSDMPRSSATTDFFAVIAGAAAGDQCVSLSGDVDQRINSLCEQLGGDEVDAVRAFLAKNTKMISAVGKLAEAATIRGAIEVVAEVMSDPDSKTPFRYLALGIRFPGEVMEAFAKFDDLCDWWLEHGDSFGTRLVVLPKGG